MLDPAYVESLRERPFDVDRHAALSHRLADKALSYLPREVDTLLLEDHYCALLALRLADRLNVRRFVVYSHLPLSARFSYFDKGADEERQQLLEATALLSADALLVPSCAARRTLSHVYPVEPSRIAVLSLGATCPALPPADLVARPARIVTVARFTEQKGWKAWLDIVAAVEARGVTPIWSLVGDGPLRPAVLARLLQLVPHSRIEWATELEPDRALPALLSRSSLFLLPSAHETFGLAALEAAAHGALPVLTTLASTAEIWGTRAVLIPPGDVAGGAERIVALLGDPVMRADAALAAWRHAVTFSWETHVNGLCSVLCDG